jgi:hypothetical protein
MQRFNTLVSSPCSALCQFQNTQIWSAGKPRIFMPVFLFLLYQFRFDAIVLLRFPKVIWMEIWFVCAQLADESAHTLLTVMLHSKNPAVFRGKHAEKKLDNAFLVSKVICVMCLTDSAFSKIAATSTALTDVLGFMRSGLDISLVSAIFRLFYFSNPVYNDLFLQLTPNRSRKWSKEVDDAMALCQHRQLALECCGAAWLLATLFNADVMNNRDIYDRMRRVCLRLCAFFEFKIC